MGFTAAINAADAADLVASAPAHFAEEEDGDLNAAPPVAAIATDLRFGTNLNSLSALHAFNASNTDKPVVDDGGADEAVTDASSPLTTRKAAAVASDNPALRVASATNQAFGDNNDGEASSSADTSHALLGTATWSDVSATNLSHAAFSASYSPEIFANLAVPAAHSSEDGSTFAAAATKSSLHAAKASEFDQNVIDISGQTLASTLVAATNDFPGPSAWASTSDTAHSLDTFAVAATVVNSRDNVFAATATSMPNALRTGTADENAVVANDSDAAVGDESVGDNPLGPDATGDATTGDATTTATADTLGASNRSDTTASAHAIRDPGDQLTTTTAPANSTPVPLTSDSVDSHSPLATTSASVESVFEGIDITDAASADALASGASTTAMASLAVFLIDAPATPTNSSSVDGVANSKFTDREASVEFLVGNPDGGPTADLALAFLHNGDTTEGAAAKTSKSVNSYDETSSSVTSC